MIRLIAIPLLAITLIGCVNQSKSAQVIPRRGDVVAHGTGQQLSFRSPSVGLVSIYDVNANAVIHSSAVNQGTVVVLNPLSGNVTVADGIGTQVVHTGISKSHRYEMWFIPQNAATTRWAS